MLVKKSPPRISPVWWAQTDGAVHRPQSRVCASTRRLVDLLGVCGQSARELKTYDVVHELDDQSRADSSY